MALPQPNANILDYIRQLILMPDGSIPSQAYPVLNAPGQAFSQAADFLGMPTDLIEEVKNPTQTLLRNPMGPVPGWAMRLIGQGFADMPRDVADSAYKILQGQGQGPLDYVNVADTALNMTPLGAALPPIAPIIGKAAGAAGLMGIMGRGERNAAIDAVEQAAKKAGPEWLEGFPNVKAFKEANPERVVYHGTPSVWDTPDPSRVSETGLVGPGHYTTSDPRLAETYAMGSTSRYNLKDLQDRVDSLTDELEWMEKYGAQYGSSQPTLIDTIKLKLSDAQHSLEEASRNMSPNIRTAILPEVSKQRRLLPEGVQSLVKMTPEEEAIAERIQAAARDIGEGRIRNSDTLGKLYQELDSIRSNVTMNAFDASRSWQLPPSDKLHAFDLESAINPDDATLLDFLMARNQKKYNWPEDKFLPEWIFDEYNPHTGDLITNHTLYQEALNKLSTRGWGRPTGIDAWDSIEDDAKLMKVLQEMGYDAIQHQGGNLMPINDAAGNPIFHTVTNVFPDSLNKIRNALTGASGGQADPRLAVGLGGAGALGLLMQQLLQLGGQEQP